MPDLPKMLRIGVRIPAATPGGAEYILGCKASVYDADTGALLPVEGVDLRIRQDAVITAVITVLVAEVTMEGQAADGGPAPGDGP